MKFAHRSKGFAVCLLAKFSRNLLAHDFQRATMLSDVVVVGRRATKVLAKHR